ncbi:drug/metabolite transporter (DMT)-like permease [Kribbella shirazensis]|uniref:Drug/metabolite transporter (DMT)-like permease n=1 Tax=Kribbella shirazensis TaxID=1105143 RepID=A0A7X5VH68_9ACTN|nr:drug/metabolite transporter (DMT)-like permease [Kribbella shirazensis]
MVLGLSAALAAAVLFGFAAILQAVGSRKVPTESELDPRRLGRFVVALLKQPAFLGALVLNLAGFGLHFVALRLLPLYLAQAGIAVSLVVTALLATRWMSDRLSALEWSAVIAVCVGLGLLAVAAGDAGESAKHHGLTIGVVVGLIAIAVLGAVASRSQHGVSTALLGLLAGLGYAGVAISARLLEDGSLGELLRSPTTYTLPISGALAFILYSLALQRGSVTLATTPMIALQTIAPAAAGVFVLGDAVRAGWWPAAGIGFLLSAAGSVILVRFESVKPD